MKSSLPPTQVLTQSLDLIKETLYIAHGYRKAPKHLHKALLTFIPAQQAHDALHGIDLAKRLAQLLVCQGEPASLCQTLLSSWYIENSVITTHS